MANPADRENVNPAVYGWFGAFLVGFAALTLILLGGPPTGAAVVLFTAGAFLIGVWMWKGL